MKNMCVRRKILVGFCIIAVIAAALGFLGVYDTVQLSRHEKMLYNIGHNSSLCSQLSSNLLRQRALIREAENALNSGNTQRRNASIAELRALETEFDALLHSLRQNLVLPDSPRYLERIAQSYGVFAQQKDGVTTALQAGDAALASELIAALDITTVADDTDDFLDYIQGVSLSTSLADARKARVSTLVLVVLTIAAFGTAIFLGLYISRIISRPIERITQAARTLATGDIQVDISYSSRDELGELSRCFQQMVDGIQQQAAVIERIAMGDFSASIDIRSKQDVVNAAIMALVENNSQALKNIRSASSEVATGAAQIAQGAQDLATGSGQQAASLQQFTNSLADIKKQITRTAANSRQASEANLAAASRLEESQRSMQHLIGAMEDISQGSKEITSIIKVIDDIGFETNILALNAAVEAARAGVHGKGFAVVAEEVRNLVAKSARAAAETARLVDDSNRRVRSGQAVLMETQKSLESITEYARESVRLISEVAVATQKQDVALDEINSTLLLVNQVVQATSCIAQESASSSEQMASQATVLNQIVSHFSLREDAPPHTTDDMVQPHLPHGLALIYGKTN